MLALALGRATTMARVPASLPAGIRVSDHISLGVIARTFPPGEVRRVPGEAGPAGGGGRRPPAPALAPARLGERARARPAVPRHGLLRDRAGPLRGLGHPGGAALPPGGPALALGRRGGQGGGQERHLAGPHPPWRG